MSDKEDRYYQIGAHYSDGRASFPSFEEVANACKSVRWELGEEIDEGTYLAYLSEKDHETMQSEEDDGGAVEHATGDVITGVTLVAEMP